MTEHTDKSGYSAEQITEAVKIVIGRKFTRRAPRGAQFTFLTADKYTTTASGIAEAVVAVLSNPPEGKNT